MAEIRLYTMLHRWLCSVVAMTPRSGHWMLPVSALALSVLSFSASGAAPLPLAPINLHHTSWTARDGAPQLVLTMAQTGDGWLWLGGPGGLYRFDGVHFERYEPPAAPLPSSSVSILSAQGDGALWIGYRYGGVSVLSQGRLRNYSEADGLPRSKAVWGLEADGDGRMWAATSAGMFYLERDRWLAGGPALSLPRTLYKTLMRDRSGILWAQGEAGVFSLAPGADRFIHAAPTSGTGVLFNLPDGSVWSWDALHSRFNRLKPPPNGAAARDWQVKDDVNSILFDRHGDLWLGRQAAVEYRNAAGDFQTGLAQGLSGRQVYAIFEDRAGNIWTATASGIDRFRQQRLSSVTMSEDSDGSALVADADGAVWVGRTLVTADGKEASGVRRLLPSSPIPWTNLVTSFYRDGDGGLWIGGVGQLWRRDQTGTHQVPVPWGGSGTVIHSMTSDQAGGLWVSLLPDDLYHRHADGTWEKKGGETGVAGEAARMVAGNEQSGVWMGYPRSRVLQLVHGQVRQFGPEQGLKVGMVSTLHLRGPHVWVGGETGLALRQQDRFITVGGADGQAFAGASGIVELENGDLWLNAAAGLFRIASSEITALKAAAGYRVRYEKLDSLDGLVGNAAIRLATPSLVQASDGQLWMMTNAGVFRLDPARRAAAIPAPPVLIRRIGQPGQLQPAVAGMRLAAGTMALQIDYTALALSMPERVNFRYQLEGIDQQWQTAGLRRAAYYNNLGPGNYRFRVEASSTDGTWSQSATSLDFDIAPTVIQTWWFKALCGAALLMACWWLYRAHIRRLAAQVSARLEARIQERERIARELHDTLLQSVQGMMLHVQAAALRLPEPEPARIEIEQALQYADDVLHEGRQRVRDLRASEEGAQVLAEALAEAGERLRLPGAAPLQVRTIGAVRSLHPIIHEEVLAIASEAIANAYRHAQAQQIEALVHYGADALRVTVRDDGLGMPPEVVAAGGRCNHWGLRGMAERADKINARITLRSQPGNGTEWLLVLPGLLAYPAAPRPWFQKS
jgi:signal transduction histidine kinase/ligand-binding sensor domain-containing protein